ncbi:MAG: MMPL family transporter [Elusimicrobiota bacterium]
MIIRRIALRSLAWHLYDQAVLVRARSSLLVLTALCALLCYWAKDFRLDASGDSLVLEHDEDVRYFRVMSERYEGSDFLVITYSPIEDLFSARSLDRLKRIREELKTLKRVSSVVTILDVPLLKNPPGTLKDLKKNLKTLESPRSDLKMAVAEFAASPIYQNLLVSQDLKSTAIQVNFRTERSATALVDRRAALREKDYRKILSEVERGELKGLEIQYRRHKDAVRKRRHEDIRAVRGIIRKHSGEARFCLGGVPMIVDDIMSFIRSDLVVFGVGMLLFLVGTLYVIYRRWRWVALPVLACSVAVLVMIGGMGLAGWDVTVVSSNFISLQLILTMSLAIHIVSRYRELLRERPQEDNYALVLDATRKVFIPALYCNLTTMAGFYSLILCDILPVVQFGWMMNLGLIVSMIIVFWMLPAAIILLPKPPVDQDQESEFGRPFTDFFARVTERHRGAVYAVSLVVAVATGVGMSRLEVENSFIDYFKESTEIYRGMKFIDENLGGTTPLDIIIDLKAEAPAKPIPAPAAKPDDEFSAFDEFEEEEADPSKYWYTKPRLETIERVHDYLNGLPETGKVLSLATLYKTAGSLNGGKPFDDFDLALLYNAMSGRFKDFLVTPYASIDRDEARVSTRIKDSMKTLRRDALIKRIRKDLVEKAGLRPDQFRVSGLMLLYNNMLQSLYSSQIQTILLTVAALFAMFLFLFRSLKLALITLSPQLLASMSVLGAMGLGGVPLDVMTITIVSISVGIAVDNAIHYVHRFEREFEKDRDYVQSMHRCHRSIGNAMLYTSLSITIGFSILSLSNFVPSILFGSLTGLAMVVACISSQALLPSLIILFKPFGPEGEQGA